MLSKIISKNLFYWQAYQFDFFMCGFKSHGQKRITLGDKTHNAVKQSASVALYSCPNGRKQNACARDAGKYWNSPLLRAGGVGKLHWHACGYARLILQLWDRIAIKNHVRKRKERKTLHGDCTCLRKRAPRCCGKSLFLRSGTKCA